MGGTVVDVDGERFHLTLSSAGQLVMQGWWGKEATAEHQYRSWIGSWGGINDARIVLAKRAAGGERVISSWSQTPEPPLLSDDRA
jgi:hypothetical protein